MQVTLYRVDDVFFVVEAVVVDHAQDEFADIWNERGGFFW